MDDGNWTVGAVDGTEEREGDGVVAAEGDDTGKSLSILCWSLLLCIC